MEQPIPSTSPAPAAPSSNKNRNILIGVGVAIVFCLCAIGVSLFALRTVVNKAKESIVTDPQEMSTVGQKIAKYTLPSGYSEQMAMDFGLYRIVMISSGSLDSPIIMLMSFNASNANPEQMQQQLQQSFEQQTGSGGITWTTVDERTVTVRGQDVKLVVREGTDTQGNVMRQAVTTFQGETDQVVVMFQGTASMWDDELIDQFLTSIQ
jgi:hypothetical protein